MPSSGIRAKEIIVALFMIAAGVLDGYYWNVFIFSEGYQSPTLFSIPILLLFFFALCFLVLALFGRSVLLGYGATAAAFIGPFFFLTPSVQILSALLLTVVTACYAYGKIQSERNTSPAFQMRRIARAGLPLFFTAAALLISVFYLAFIEMKNQQALIPKEVFDFSLPLAERALRGAIPGFQSGATVDELLFGVLIRQSGTPVDFQTLSKEERNQLLESVRTGLARGLGITLTGKENAADLLYELANQRVVDFLGTYSRYIPYISAFGFFLTVKIVTLPFYLITLGAGYLVMRLMLATGVLRKEKTLLEVERIVW